MAYSRLDKNLSFDEDWKHEMKVVLRGQADQNYCEKLCQEAQKTALFVQDHGVLINHHDEKNVLLEFKTRQHFVFPEGGGKAMIDCLMRHIGKNRNCDVHWETEGRYLLTDKRGAIRRLQVRKKDGLLYDLHAPNVVLACGGFEGNREMLAIYIGPRTHELPLIAPEFGASTAGSFDGMHCELVDTRATKPDAVIWGHNYGIVVNEHCKRFYDQGERHLFATFEMNTLELWRDHNQKGFFVTDATIMDRFRPGWVYDTTDQEPEKADTIHDLAVRLGIDPKELEKTVSKFDAACNNKQFDLMKLDGKSTTGLSPNESNWANLILTSPFYGSSVTSHLAFTYGGVKTNTDAQVLTTNDVPIPGLYAAGGMTGLSYNKYPPSTSVLRSLTFGRLAGTAIAETLNQGLLQKVKSVL